MYTENQLIRPVRRRRARAFTLIELLLVLVILAVLAAVVVPKFTARSEQARQTAAKTDIANLETALDAFEVDCGRYPSNEEGLRALLEPPGNAQSWHGPYVKRAPNDPWGNPYVYRFPGAHNASSYDLFSMGAEGREGPNNITNWDK
ncbi:MAG: type II secretion system major pseudopilin GspG [Tepidisphaerales bacterium]